MDSSGIISIVAIVSTLIISIISLLISFRINIINLKAKRSEIAFEKRLEAFRVIVEAIGKIKITYANYVNDNENSKNELIQAVSNFYNVYRSQLVFLPPHIERLVHIPGSSTIDISNLIYREDWEIRFNCESIIKIEPFLIDDIQNFIGPK